MNNLKQTNAKVWMAALALAVGGVANVPSFAADPAPMNDTAKPDAKPTAAATDTPPAPAAEGVRKSLAEITQAAVTKGQFNVLVRHFVDADRNRLGPDVKSDNPKLDEKIAEFREHWTQKYGKDFDFPKDTLNVLGDRFGKISEGEIGEAKTASGTIVPSNEPKVKVGSAEALKESGVAKTDENSTKLGGGDTNKDIGRNIATVTLPAVNGMPEVNVPMIHELPNDWKLDLPDDIDAPRLQENLLKHVTMVDDDHANWPADPFEACRILARHVVMATLDSDAAPNAAK